MFIARTRQDITSFIATCRQGKSARVAFVPTMGALHEGHLSLIRLAKQKADIVVASVFVNPTQFGPNEDYGRYPRDEEGDAKLLAGAGCDAVFMPSVDEIYGRDVKADISKVRNDDILCGAFRPGHFAGVVTVVGRLFDIIKPDVAVFGEKDFQQLWILRDNFKDIEIVGAPILRESDGLAMSSRNRYLSEAERAVAAKLNVTLRDVIGWLATGIDTKTALESAKNAILNNGFDKLDYIELREDDSLETTKKVSGKTRVFAAVWLGKTRLIDNYSGRIIGHRKP